MTLLRRCLPALSHHAYALFLTTVAAVSLWPPSKDHHPSSLLHPDLVGLLEGLAVGGIVPLLLLTLTHDAGLCERCVRNVPLNAQQRATGRWRPVLRAFHAFTSGPGMAFYFAVIFIPEAFPISRGWRYVFQLSLIPLLVAYGASQRVHRRFHPWCPFCNWDDGGAGMREPSPDPAIPLPV